MPPAIFFGAPDSSLLTIAVFWTVLYVWAGSELYLGYRLSRRDPDRQAPRDDAGSKWVVLASVWLGVALGIALSALVPSIAFMHGRRVLFVAGIAIALMGMGLRWYSIWFLGRSFTCEVAVRPGQEVIDTGPYRLIRHPSYTGGLLTLLGLLLCLTNPIALVGLLVTAAGYAYRITVEERVLARELGDSYRLYMRRTKRLIPFVL
jgi:protein-S-isoprenylcysteine O-methyltransferase Ste14